MDPDRSFFSRSLIATLTALLVAIAAWLFVSLWVVVADVFAGLIIAAALLLPVRLMEERGLPRAVAILASYAGVLAVLASLLLIVVPPLVSQAQNFATQLPSFVRTAADQTVRILGPLGGPSSTQGLVDQITSYITSDSGVLSILTQLPMSVFALLEAVGATVFLSAFMLNERDRARDFLLRFVHPDDHEAFVQIGTEAVNKLGSFVRGQLVIMSITGAASAAGLTLLGVPYALPLGVLAFAAEAVPIIGPFAFAIPMLAAGFSQSVLTGLLTLGLILLIEQSEALILVPLVHSRVVSVSPLVALVVVVAGGDLAGVLGALFAIPLTAVAIVLVNDVILPWRQGAWRRPILVAQPGGAAEEAIIVG